MMNYRYSILYGLFGALLLASCVKSLEDRPLELITEDYLWDSKDSAGTNASYFLNNIYSNLPTGFNRIGGNVLDAATDDAVASEDGSTISTFTNGGYNALTGADNVWSKNYAAIRMSNMFLQNFYKVHLKQSLRLEGQYWKAEARALRAIFYYELVKRYGGVPIIGDKVLTLDDDLKLPRNTFDECVSYIASECDAVKDSLRPDPATVGDYGRITQAVALTLKAKVLLLAASPLNNPSNDINRWIRAKNAAADVIRLNVFSLEPSFANVFTSRSNSEVILAYQRSTSTDLENNNAPVGYISGSTTSQGRTSPTQELVDAFPTIKGLPITTDIKSPVNPTGYDASNPYANRDPRLSLTVFYNGMNWLSRPVETFDGGRDRPGGSAIQTKTGYYMRKFLGDFANNTAYSAQNHNFIIFRYADVLLSFAEAKNEVDGPVSVSDSIYTYLKAIRKRAGINAGDDEMYGLGSTLLSKADMRNLIRNERRIEMAFEEQRFWDLRRWKIAENVYNKPLHGIRITKTGPLLDYRVETLNIPFQFIAPRMYRYAIPYSEIIKNPNLTQNPGYE
ncbi:RagB/SusD family nutrient uptake outer membrane protein [Pedobacter sp. BS3]|uniref:RagB/SusD family nutrient uptake outer membrane protein n=1 Tax=Pedobacter sp. BS3 TaxID=2567937 RepID=UPI0011EC1E64|nr:RagB/SusD family nutrient uptake outer membrane protein [Pedobacter sp. BS3]TZF82786.1 RagB/SusD family nutrient uptake outer membrane protein [Pedobacter sp. BS3]